MVNSATLYMNSIQLALFRLLDSVCRAATIWLYQSALLWVERSIKAIEKQ